MTQRDDQSNGNDHAATNEELLSQLDAAKKAHGEFRQRKELLRDPEISRLVYRLAEVNRPWIDTCVRSQKVRLGLRDSEEELASLALTGVLGPAADVTGVLGAILQFDLDRFGVRSFSRYMRRAIQHALEPSPKETRQLEATLPLSQHDRDGRHNAWVDRRQRQPRELAIDAELLGVLRESIEALPPRNREVADYIVSYLDEHGERPTAREVAENRNPPVTKQMGDLLMKQTLQQLKEKIEERYPRLAEDGVGGWEQFSAIFGIHKHQDAGAQR